MDPAFLFFTLSSWLARELGGGRRKLKIDISMPLNLPGLCGGAFIKMPCYCSVIIVLNVKMVRLESC